MKTLKKIAVVLAVVLGIGMLASCEFSTFGMENLTADDVTESWVKGKWEGKSATFTLQDGSLKKSESDDSVVIDCTDSSIITKATRAATVIVLKGAAATGELYADAGRAHMVYKVDVEDKEGNVTSSVRYDLKKVN